MGGRQARRKAVLESLKGQFDCILLDSPSLQEGEDVLGAAALADGVLMVVASGSSTQKEVVYTAKAVAAAGGKIEGCCFNRRRYPIPAFLYRLFRR
jgi:Mrp family chromosome partitioning ATPase